MFTSDSASQGESQRRREIFELIAISFVSLFLELALIRFINSTVQVIAYFNNFLLISAFLGLGFGSYLVPRKRDVFQFFPMVLFAVIVILIFLDRFGVVSDLTDVVFWAATSVRQNLPAPFVVLLVFCCNFLFFVPLGYKLGTCLNQFENRLHAYSLDLIGSLLGVAAFSLISFFRSEPWLWFTIAGVVVSFLLFRNVRLAVLSSALILGAIFLATIPEKGIWSPYYKVSTHAYRPETLGYFIRVDKLRIQDALNFSTDLAHSKLAPWISYYRMPYVFRDPGEMLILGGGAGNDAAMALRFHPKQVEVVEIDPVLVQLGFDLHPHKPYTDARVKVITDDARAYTRRSKKQYDMIVMNALDSHHQLPGLSTLRLESFIYTVEAFRDVKKHMRPGSIFVVHLASTRKWMGERLFGSLTEAFGQQPRLFTTRDSPFGSVAFVYGPDDVIQQASRSSELKVVDPQTLRSSNDNLRLATDDWPHLYLADNRLPALYLYVLGAIVLITLLTFLKSAKSLAESSGLHFFLLGAGFMLLETRSITKSALLFGATWIVNAVVIASILIVILLGNLLIQKRQSIGKGLCYAGLLGSLLLGYLVPIDFILAYPIIIRFVLSVLWIGLPIFFASLIFSHSFRTVKNTSAAFGTNLLGVVIGGVLEYSSMMYGLNFLYLLAAVVYLFAMLADPVLNLKCLKLKQLEPV